MRLRPIVSTLLPAAFALAIATVASAQPVIGFIERWNAPPSVAGWASNATLSNPGTGGTGGAGDGFLLITRPTALQLGAHSEGLEFTGDWNAANVNEIKLALDDVGANQALEIHVSVGNTSNLWQYNVGFSPPENAWGVFTVDLTDSTKFTHIIAFDGKGFLFALANADNVLIRHDKAPFSQTPDGLAGEFGVDDFELTSSLLAVPGTGGSLARPVELAAPYPNPARGEVACAFETFDESPVRVTVLDPAGRIVRALTLPAAAPGRRVWVWDGRDNRGQIAAAGAYRVRMTGAGGGTSRPLVRL